jgi:uncharacterized membrane protein (DUF485 family)
MDHGPAVEWKEDKSLMYKEKIGVFLFIIYCIIYFGFIIINTVAPKLMELKMFLGLNLAVVYGFGLIIIAIIMGLIYNHLCTKKENELNKDDGGEK